MNKPQSTISGRTRRRRWWPAPRIWAVALVAFRQGMRMRLWILVPLAILILMVADLSAPRFDPVFDGIPAAVSTSLLVMTVLAVIAGIFLATYSLPAEMETKIVQSVVTKPVSRGELVAGKMVGMALLLGAMLAAVGVGAYIYVTVRAGSIRTLAARRLVEARPHAVHPADLNALEAVAQRGPLAAYRYRRVTRGPKATIDFGPAGPPEADAAWILGQTGMRLVWDLTRTPLADWAAAGPSRVRLALAVRPPPESAKADIHAYVNLISPQEPPPSEAGSSESAPLPVRQIRVPVPASGELAIPVAGPDARPARGILNVPAAGSIFLEILADTGGGLLGVRPGAVRIIGPTGQEFLVSGMPEVRLAHEGSRLMLVGRGRLPRQAAVFRFDGAPHATSDRSAIPVEIGFSLDAWSPAMVQPTVEATFTALATGHQKVFQFTPESRHAALLYLDREFWRSGPLEVRLESLTADNYLGLVPASVQLRQDGGPFALHLAAAVLRVWLFGTVLAAVGIALSTRVTWYVGILGTITVLVVSLVRDFLLRSTALGYAAWGLARWADAKWHWSGWDSVTPYIVLPVPNLPALLPPDSVAAGQVMPLGDLAAALGWTALGVAILATVGALLLGRREVAA